MNTSNPGRAGARGFTLIEVMIVVVILAILAVVAVPSYREYVLRTNRAVGKSMLTQVVDRQEQFYAANKSYSTSLAQLGFPANPFFVDRRGQPAAANVAGAIYRISLAANNANFTFTVTAVPVNRQVEDTKCTQLAINQAGQRTATGTSSDCW
jgi:type IV pilus assembly protein PilE